MSEIIQIVPSEWVTEDLLVKMTGLRPGTIARARKKKLAMWQGVRPHVAGQHPKGKQRVLV